MIKGFRRTWLFILSMICFFGAYLGLCSYSSNNYVNELRNADPGIRLMAAVLVILLGSFLFYRWRRTHDAGSVKEMVTIWLVVSALMVGYGFHVANDLLVIDLQPYVNAPVVAGYDREGYVEQYPSLNVEMMEEGLASIGDPEKREQVRYLLDTAGFYTEIYEDFQNFETRADGAIHNGDELSVTVDFDETYAEEHHISFDNVFLSFDVSGLPEKPAIEWGAGRDQLIDLVLSYEHSLGSDANLVEVTGEYDNGDVELVAAYLEGEYKEARGYYRINRGTLIGENQMTGYVIDFNKFY